MLSVTMKIIGMMTVRNEEDIVEECLDRANEYHDLIYVVDCGSDDQTVKIIKSVVARLPQVKFLGEIGPRHSRQVKRHIWSKFRDQFGLDTWWSVVDADEFLDEDPRPFVELAEAELADHIFSKSANFYLTDLELNKWLVSQETFADRERVIEERLTYYRMHTSQVRIFRNLPWLRWNEDTHLPSFLAKPAQGRPVYRHYQYRDPVQIQNRIRTRREWLKDSAVLIDNPHWDKEEWRQAIASADDPSLKKAVPGIPLEPDPELPKPNKEQSFLKTISKYGYAFLIGFATPQKTTKLF